MSRYCQLTGKKPQFGNKVSHSKISTRRSFGVNLQRVTLVSELLQKKYSLRIAVSTLRTIDYKGGLDKFLLASSTKNLSDEAVKIRRQLRKVSA